MCDIPPPHNWFIIVKLSCRTGFWVFFIKWPEVCKCFPWEWFIASLPGCNQSSRLFNVWTIGAAGRVFYLVFPLRFFRPFISTLILIVVEMGFYGGGGATFEGWMVCRLQSRRSFIFFIAHKEKQYIITQHNNTPPWVMDRGWLPLATTELKVKPTFTFFSRHIFACWQQHSMSKQRSQQRPPLWSAVIIRSLAEEGHANLQVRMGGGAGLTHWAELNLSSNSSSHVPRHQRLCLNEFTEY